jgi:hypothetical protein
VSALGDLTLGLKPQASRFPDRNQRRNVAASRAILAEEAFQRMLALQHKRGLRSRQSFLLMLLKLETQLSIEMKGKVLAEVLSLLATSTRETDVAGWYQAESVAGVLFTEINLDRESSIPRTMLMRVRNLLRNHLSPRQFEELGITLQLLPESAASEYFAPAKSSEGESFHGIIVPRTL